MIRIIIPPGAVLPRPDLAAEGRRHTLMGECNWWKSPVGVNVLRGLREKAACRPAGLRERTRLALFSLSGFTDTLRAAEEEEGVTLVSGADILRPE